MNCKKVKSLYKCINSELIVSLKLITKLDIKGFKK